MFFIESTINSVATSGSDGWLSNLHTLLLIDDTVIFTNYQKQMCKKLKLLKKSADDIGMVIHLTKFHYICEQCTDKEDFCIRQCQYF